MGETGSNAVYSICIDAHKWGWVLPGAATGSSPRSVLLYLSGSYEEAYRKQSCRKETDIVYIRDEGI